MESMKVLLVEDDKSVCSRFVECADSISDIRIVDITGDADQAVKLIKDHLPQAVILDLELHHGSGSGLNVLKEVQNSDFQPFFLVTTNNSSVVTYEIARKLGADYILSKHQTGYSEQEALDMLLLMKDEICARRKSGIPASMETPYQIRQRILRRITAEFDLVGISPSAVGRQYLAEAVIMVMESQSANVISAIAQKHKKTESSVERAMQYAIDRAWRTMDVDELVEHYKARIPPDRGAPTTMKFVYYYAELIKNEL